MNALSLRLKAVAGVTALAASLTWGAAAQAADTIKVGILHSLSGTMAISETTLKDVMLMLIAEQNKKGGLLGKKLEAVVVDPASNWPLFAEKARELISKHKVAAVFGCWTSVSRKSVLPVFKELNSLLFYPVQYEGEESQRNVFYTGAAPNQQAIPAVDYLMKEESVKRWVLAGTDYVYPRTTNKILAAYLKAKGVADKDIMINYTPFGHSDWQTIVANIKKFGSAGKKTAVVSTINGDANVPFYKELANQGVKAEDIPVIAFSVGEEELAGIDTKPLVGHLAAWNYFQSVEGSVNADFIKKRLPHFRDRVDAVNVTDNPSSVLRLSGLAASLFLIREGIEPIMQVTCRDKNRLALGSEILGGAAFGVRNLLVVTGDHPLLGSIPSAKPVFDLDSVSLIKAVVEMHETKSFLGEQDIKTMPAMFVGGAANPFAEPLEYRVDRLEKKASAGAAFVQTQPVFDIDVFTNWMEKVRERGLHERIHIIPGIMPLKSPKAARYMKEDVPGVIMPDETVERMEKAEDAAEEGFRIAMETVEALRRIDGVAGIHLMPVMWEAIIPRIVEEAGLLPRPATPEDDKES